MFELREVILQKMWAFQLCSKSQISIHCQNRLDFMAQTIALRALATWFKKIKINNQQLELIRYA